MADTPTSKKSNTMMWLLIALLLIGGTTAFVLIRRKKLQNAANAAQALEDATGTGTSSPSQGNTGATGSGIPSPGGMPSPGGNVIAPTNGIVTSLPSPPVTGMPATLLPGGNVIVPSTSGTVTVATTPKRTVLVPTPVVLTAAGHVVANTNSLVAPQTTTALTTVAMHNVAPAVVIKATTIPVNTATLNNSNTSGSGVVPVISNGGHIIIKNVGAPSAV